MIFDKVLPFQLYFNFEIFREEPLACHQSQKFLRFSLEIISGASVVNTPFQLVFICWMMILQAEVRAGV